MTPDKFYHDQPPLPWQRNLGQNRLVQEISLRALRLSGVIEVVLSNDVNQILKRPTMVAMATKFETKQPIIPLV